MFSLDNVKLDITKEAIERVADLALELKTGARGLRTILEDALLDVMYATPADKTIDKIRNAFIGNTTVFKIKCDIHFVKVKRFHIKFSLYYCILLYIVV